MLLGKGRHLDRSDVGLTYDEVVRVQVDLAVLQDLGHRHFLQILLLAPEHARYWHLERIDPHLQQFRLLLHIHVLKLDSYLSQDPLFFVLVARDDVLRVKAEMLLGTLTAHDTSDGPNRRAKTDVVDYKQDEELAPSVFVAYDVVDVQLCLLHGIYEG